MTTVTTPDTVAPTPRPARAGQLRRRDRLPAAPSSRCCSATSTCCSKNAGCSSSARSCSRCCWCSCSPTCSRRSARASAAAAAAARRSRASLVAGVIGLAIVFQGIQAVALPLVQEFGYSKEIEDRVLAAAADADGRHPEDRDRDAAGPDRRRPRVPDRGRSCRPRRCTSTSTGSILLTLAPLAGWVAAALGLVLGTRVAAPERVVPVRPRGAAADVPRRHLLPVEGAGGRALAADRSCS